MRHASSSTPLPASSPPPLRIWVIGTPGPCETACVRCSWRFGKPPPLPTNLGRAPASSSPGRCTASREGRKLGSARQLLVADTGLALLIGARQRNQARLQGAPLE